MYAVIQTGGKQYRVEPGQTLTIEKIAADLGDTIEFDQVLLVSNEGNVTVGKPTVGGAKVTAEVVQQEVLGEKLVVFKFKRRKNYVRRNGHRQEYTRVKIGQVVAP
jgi:large subunit ribosomal protein L21